MEIEQPAPEFNPNDGPKTEAKPRRRRARAKWADLHEALSQLKQARALASENARPAGEIGSVEKAGT
jgi:hypothetical protein